MIAFEHPQALLLALPLLAFWALFMRLQRRALAWILAHVGERFRDRFSRHSPRSLAWHGFALLVLGLLLIVAAGRPIYLGPGEALADSGRVLFLIDASASMRAGDVAEHAELSDEELANRFEVTRHLAESLVGQLAGYRFAVVTFSGVATFNLPMTDQEHLLREAIRSLEVHTFYQNTGSSFTSALDTVFHFAAAPEGREQDADLQVVLISDGEQPRAESYDEALDALADQEIPVHTLAVGSLEGENREIYDFRDVVAGKKGDDRTVLSSFTTRRVEEHLQRMSERTDGCFAVASPAALDALVTAIRERPQRVIHEEAGTDLSFWALLAFTVAFLAHNLLLGSRRPDGGGFDVRRLGEPSRGRRPGEARRKTPAAVGGALLLTLFVGVAGLPGCGGEGPAWRAHQENERGISQDQLGHHEAAVPHYERSLGFGIDPQIPTYNLARSHAERDQFSIAHQLNQRALELDPELAEAYFNDGVVLYRWGRAERDPRGCELERTLDLWRQAAERFRIARQLAETGSPLAESAGRNWAFLISEILDIEELIANPPEACQCESSSDSSSSCDSPPPPQGSDPPPPQGSDPPPPQGSDPPPPQGSDPPPPQGSDPPPPQGSDPPPPQGSDPPPPQGSDPPPPQGSDPPPPPGSDPPPPQGSDPPPSEPPPSQGSEPPPPQGSDPPPVPPPPGSSGGGGGSSEPENGDGNDQTPLSAGEREKIRQALERIAEQRQGEGKYHRRSRLEQFPRAAWENPEAEIWW